jgi:hypothetical protein
MFGSPKSCTRTAHWESSQSALYHRTRPPLDDVLKLGKTISQSGGPGLQDQWRLYLVHILALHGRSSVEARPRHHPLGPELLAAPRGDDQFRLSRDHLIDGHHPILGGALNRTVGKDVDTACDLNELRNRSHLIQASMIC